MKCWKLHVLFLGLYFKMSKSFEALVRKCILPSINIVVLPTDQHQPKIDQVHYVSSQWLKTKWNILSFCHLYKNPFMWCILRKNLRADWAYNPLKIARQWGDVNYETHRVSCVTETHTILVASLPLCDNPVTKSSSLFVT